MAEQRHGPNHDPRDPDIEPTMPDATSPAPAADDTSAAQNSGAADSSWTPSSGGYSGAGARSPKDFPGQSSFQPMAPPSYDTPTAPADASAQPLTRRAAMIAGISVAVIVLIVIIWAFTNL